MDSLILYEGKTDTVLLSYYLEKICGWMHRKTLKSLDIKVDKKKDESAYWYSKDGENLLIHEVGGKDNFNNFFKQKIQATVIDSSAFRLLSGMLHM